MSRVNHQNSGRALFPPAFYFALLGWDFGGDAAESSHATPQIKIHTSLHSEKRRL
jgi:hypothetical protein